MEVRAISTVEQDALHLDNASANPRTLDSLAKTGVTDGRTAALPVLALLGVALPLYFLAGVQGYLFYLEPVELIPTYACAWLILAMAIALPYVLIFSILKVLGRRSPQGLAYRLVTGITVSLSAAMVIAALLYSMVSWLRSFGLLTGTFVLFYLVVATVGLAVLIAATRWAGYLYEWLSFVPVGLTLLGGASVVSLTFFNWAHDDAAITQSAEVPAGAPNIVLLTIDALSAPHMSLYGAARPTTPALSAFAQTAMTFENAYANGNFTTPGVTSILTGTRPWSHRALQLSGWPLADARRNSLPAVLSRRGYQLGYVSTNPVAGPRKLGLGDYFQFASSDRILGPALCSDHYASRLKYLCSASQLHLFAQCAVLLRTLSRSSGNLDFDPRLAIEPALAWLHAVDKSRPVFIWVHLFPPHSPYAAPKPWLGMFDKSAAARLSATSETRWLYLYSELPPQRTSTLQARYEESVRYVDYYAADFLRQAQQILGSNTAIIVTADHGESFGHGYGAHTGPGLFDEIIHVPLIIKLPRQESRIASPVVAEQVDIAPTLASLIGIRAPKSWEGKSLLDAWSPVSAERADPAYSMNFEENRVRAALTTGAVSVIDGNWKLIHYMGILHYPDMPKRQDELYDLSSDRRELVNRANTEPIVHERLLTLIQAQLREHGGRVKTDAAR